jgi:hypothetical protein
VATGNRLSEAVPDTILSLFTVSQLMSVVTFNQTTHELIAVNRADSEAPPAPPHTDLLSDDYSVRQGNQVLFSAHVFNPSFDPPESNRAQSLVASIESFALRFLTLIAPPGV